jgi:hypothetical protein
MFALAVLTAGWFTEDGWPLMLIGGLLLLASGGYEIMLWVEVARGQMR